MGSRGMRLRRTDFPHLQYPNFYIRAALPR